MDASYCCNIFAQWANLDKCTNEQRMSEKAAHHEIAFRSTSGTQSDVRETRRVCVRPQSAIINILFYFMGISNYDFTSRVEDVE